MTLKKILQDLKCGNIETCYKYREYINNEVLTALNEEDPDIETLKDLIMIGNITYNNTNRDLLPIDDGLYDMLVVKLQDMDYDSFTPGAEPITFVEANVDRKVSTQIDVPFKILEQGEKSYYGQMMFPEIIDMNRAVYKEDLYIAPFTFQPDDMYISKRQRNVAHNHPQLVGTLDKCKFTTIKKAGDAGMLGDPNVKIFDRDFMAPLIMNGIINEYQDLDMIISLKYDGVSVEADVNTEIISARTRGDTENDLAADLTPILGGYRFPRAVKLDKPIGIKFEAIIRYPELQILNELRGTSYINGRTAIIGLLGSSDAYKYRDLITLVPLQADFGEDVQISRLNEIEFLNRYYTTRENLRYVHIKGHRTYTTFLVDKFVEEAQWARDWLPFMYDGVVVEFADSHMRKVLGRKNAINKYAMAIKFETLIKQTIFRGFTYTVGLTGEITPMIHYDPIEFMGAIHVKSTGSSLARFNTLDLHIGDIIEVEYRNDVMPYVSNVKCEANTQNHMRPKTEAEKFPTHCPSCGTALAYSTTGATASCPNMDCNERVVQRLSATISRLGIKDFSDAAIEILGATHLWELMVMTIDDMEELGPTNKQKFYGSLRDLYKHQLLDYRVIGSLGFSGIAATTWKLIFKNIPLIELDRLFEAGDVQSIYNSLISIHGVGKGTIETIINEWSYFKPDIRYIIDTVMYIPSPVGSEDKVKYVIRFTGFRDRELTELLDSFDYIDCTDGSVTKSTTILLVPYVGYNEGSKCKKADKYGIQKVAITEFLDNPQSYIPELQAKLNK